MTKIVFAASRLCLMLGSYCFSFHRKVFVLTYLLESFVASLVFVAIFLIALFIVEGTRDTIVFEDSKGFGTYIRFDLGPLVPSWRRRFLFDKEDFFSVKRRVHNKEVVAHVKSLMDKYFEKCDYSIVEQDVRVTLSFSDLSRADYAHLKKVMRDYIAGYVKRKQAELSDRNKQKLEKELEKTNYVRYLLNK